MTKKIPTYEELILNDEKAQKRIRQNKLVGKYPINEIINLVAIGVDKAEKTVQSDYYFEAQRVLGELVKAEVVKESVKLLKWVQSCMELERFNHIYFRPKDQVLFKKIEDKVCNLLGVRTVDKMQEKVGNVIFTQEYKDKTKKLN